MEVTKRKNYTASSGKTFNDKDSQQSKGLSSNDICREPEFKYGILLGAVLFFPSCIIFAFGGRPTLIALCFGLLIAYIFDLLGGIEAAIMTIVVTLIAIWATVMWSSRFILQENITNLALNFTLGVVLIYAFVVMAGHFRTLRIEFESLFYVMESVIFATLPLLASSILTWFLCVEMPAIDLPTCFSSCYFLLVVLLGGPRKSSLPIMRTPLSDSVAEKYLLSPETIVAMYLVPILMSPILFLILHHNILSFSTGTLVGLLESIMFPTLLVILAAERHLEYWAFNDRPAIATWLSNSKLLLFFVLICCVQSHPLLDDIKGFSGLDDLTSSVAICGSCFFVCVAVFTHRSVRNKRTRRILVNICVGISSLLIGITLGLSSTKALPALIGGAVAIAEFYQKVFTPPDEDGSALRFLDGVMDAILVVIACFSTSCVVASFVGKTLWSLSFTFTWQGWQVDMKDFSLFSAFLAMFAVAIPVLVIT